MFLCCVVWLGYFLCHAQLKYVIKSSFQEIKQEAIDRDIIYHTKIEETRFLFVTMRFREGEI